MNNILRWAPCLMLTTQLALAAQEPEHIRPESQQKDCNMINNPFDPHASQSLVQQLDTFYNGVISQQIPAECYFHKDYIQTADGVHLDLDGFKKHLAFLQKATTKINIKVLEASLQNEFLADRHSVEVTTRSGEKATIEVIQISTLQDGKIIRLNELSRVVEGEAALKRLAHATTDETH